MPLTLHAFVAQMVSCRRPAGPGEDPGTGSSLSGWSFLPIVTQDIAAAMGRVVGIRRGSGGGPNTPGASEQM
jgi:hypothetical protein